MAALPQNVFQGLAGNIREASSNGKTLHVAVLIWWCTTAKLIHICVLPDQQPDLLP